MLRDSTEKGKHLGLGIEPVIPSLTLGRTAEHVSGRRQNADEDLSCGNLAEAVRRPRQRVAAVINHGDVAKVPLICELHFPTRGRQNLTKQSVGFAESFVTEC